MYADFIYEWLDTCLDYGMSEQVFWESTIAEIERFTKSKARCVKREAKEKAIYVYNLAQLIGCSFSKTISSEAKFPTIEEAFPTLFEEKKPKVTTEKQVDISALRFIQFAKQFNSKYEGGGKE